MSGGWGAQQMWEIMNQMMGGWGGFGPFWATGLFNLLILAGLTVGVVVLVQRLGRPRGFGQILRHEDSALEILKKRYARGEIGKEEFEAMKRDLA